MQNEKNGKDKKGADYRTDKPFRDPSANVDDGRRHERRYGDGMGYGIHGMNGSYQMSPSVPDSYTYPEDPYTFSGYPVNPSPIDQTFGLHAINHGTDGTSDVVEN